MEKQNTLIVGPRKTKNPKRDKYKEISIWMHCSESVEHKTPGESCYNKSKRKQFTKQNGI